VDRVHDQDGFGLANNTASGWANSGDALSTGTWDTHYTHMIRINTVLSCSDCHGHNGEFTEPQHVEGAKATAGTPIAWANLDVALASSLGLRGAPSYSDPADQSGIKSCDNISCHYGLTPDWGMRSAAGLITLADQAGPAGTTVTAPQTAYVVDNASFVSSVTGNVTVTSFTAANASGTATSADVTAVSIYDNTAGALVGNATPSGATWSWSGAYAYNNTGATHNLDVRVDLGSGATDGADFTILVSAITGNVTYNAVTSNLFNINNPAVLSTTVLPPVFDPVITRALVPLGIFMSRATSASSLPSSRNCLASNG
jgi:hypothetical protein